MDSSPTIAGTSSISILEAPLPSAASQSSSLRSISSKFSSELPEKLDANLRRRLVHENSDFSADESDGLAWKGKQKEGSQSPNNGIGEVRAFFPRNSFLF